MINVVSWNINSIRIRLDHIASLESMHKPDVILLQETKVQDHQFPREVIEDMGYNLFIHGEKSYNGVAILSKGPIEDGIRNLPGDDSDMQCRYAECITTVKGVVIRVASVYVPNGTSVKSDKFPYKLRFFERLNAHFTNLQKYDEPFIVGGDYNVAPENIDVYSPEALDGQLGFHIEERKRFRGILANGMYDSYRVLQPKTQDYSWWDYRASGWPQNKGMRIDHLLINSKAYDIVAESGIYKDFRAMDKPSDHVPIYCKLKSDR